MQLAHVPNTPAKGRPPPARRATSANCQREATNASASGPKARTPGYQTVNAHDQPLDVKGLESLSTVDSYPRAARIRSRISFAAAGMLVPGPKIAFTPFPIRNS